jgi:hypothetical protein
MIMTSRRRSRGCGKDENGIIVFHLFHNPLFAGPASKLLDKTDSR